MEVFIQHVLSRYVSNRSLFVILLKPLKWPKNKTVQNKRSNTDISKLIGLLTCQFSFLIMGQLLKTEC